MKRGWLACLFLCLCASLFAQGRTLKVGSWNVRNYLLEDRSVDGSFYRNYPKPESEKQALRAAIVDANPDILVLQEMGAQDFLEELQRDLKTDGIDYSYALVFETRHDKRWLAVLSRERIKNSHLLDDLSFQYFGKYRNVCRGLMELDFETQGVEWTLYNVHLKSRYTSRKDDYQSAKYRKLEAQVVRDYIRKHFPDEKSARYLIMGDFNDTFDKPAVQRFLNISGRKLAKEIPVADKRGEKWTYFYERKRVYEQVDFALAGLGWEDANVLLNGSIYAMPDGLLTQASDHRLILVEMSFP